MTDAISLLGSGDVLIQGGGAANAKDKVVQHNGKGTVTIKDYTAIAVGKVYRSCGNCSNNGGPRKVIIENLRANGVTSDVVGINSNVSPYNSSLRVARYLTSPTSTATLLPSPARAELPRRSARSSRASTRS
jgi:hypothetical protein